MGTHADVYIVHAHVYIHVREKAYDSYKGVILETRMFFSTLYSSKGRYAKSAPLHHSSIFSAQSALPHMVDFHV